MLEYIVRQFIDFQLFVNAVPFGVGHINDTFKVEVRQNDRLVHYLLQRINHQVFQQPERVMENISLIAQHLSHQDYPLKILTPFPLKLGAWVHQDAEANYWRLFPFFENTITFDKVESEEQAYKAAKAFGAFAKSLNEVDVSRLRATIPGFHDGQARLAQFKIILQKAIPERLQEASAEVEMVLDNQLIFNKIAKLNLPLRAIHHDTKINNLLFDKDTLQPVAVVDLDTVMPGIILSDFGDMVRTFTCPADEDEVDLEKVEMRPSYNQAVSEGFLSEMRTLLIPAELENLGEGGRWMTLMQALRFLGDYLMGDVYYKTKYPGHNLIRAKNQLALFHSMLRQDM